MAASRLETPIRVLLVCDLPVIAWGLARLIDIRSPGMRCAGVAATSVDALKRLREESGAVILLDMDGDTGFGPIPQLVGSGGVVRRASSC